MAWVKQRIAFGGVELRGRARPRFDEGLGFGGLGFRVCGLGLRNGDGGLFREAQGLGFRV